ncbi:hypothetical protein [Rosistilla oblonga]|uniref:hypothetical protein n=1 Tax=Rosistilla oblonga TaxID=2527990 RepID=UPI003A97FA2E
MILVPDLDRPGQDGATRSGGHLAGIAASVRIARLPGEIVETGGADVRDCIARHGADTVRSAIDAAEPWQPRDGDAPKDDRPEVTLTLRYAWHVDQVTEHLGRLGWETPWLPEKKREARKLYQRGGQLVEVVEQAATGAATKKGKLKIATGTPRIRPLPPQQLPLRIADACQLMVEKGSDEEIVVEAVPPPRWLVDGVYTAGSYGDAIRPLEGIVTAPTIRPDGSVLQSPGWDAETGLIFRPSIDYPEIPEEPTQEDAAAAAAELLGVVEDFPFFAPADRSAWLAMLLSMIARPCIPGCVPMFGIGANIRGAGKSMLHDAASLIAYGHSPARTAYAIDDNEMRKRITAVAMEAAPAVLLDNIDCQLGGAALDAALTAERWKDRELQYSRTIDLPMRTVWVATGNNLSYGADLARRVVPIRLDSPLERPEDRSGFRHADLLGWVRSRRPKLVVAALTAMRAYFAAGCPTQTGGTFGSFEGWASTIRAAIVWAGLADPMATRETAAQDDRSADIVRGLVGGLLEIDDSGEGLTCREICERLNCPANADRYPTLRDAVAEVATVKNSADAKKLGYVLRKYRGRVAGGYRLNAESGHRSTLRWSAVPVRPGGDGGDGGDTPTHSTREGVCVTHPHVTHTYAYRGEAETSPPSPPSPPSTGQEVEL